MTKSKKTQIVRVEWEDAATWTGWRDHDEIAKLAILKQTTIGFLISRDKELLRVAASYAPSPQGREQFSDVWLIPAKNVISRKVIDYL